MKAIGKLGLLKSVGDKQWAILGEEEKVLDKIDLNDWLMDKIGEEIVFTVGDRIFSVTYLGSAIFGEEEIKIVGE